MDDSLCFCSCPVKHCFSSTYGLNKLDFLLITLHTSRKNLSHPSKGDHRPDTDLKVALLNITDLSTQVDQLISLLKDARDFFSPLQ